MSEVHVKDGESLENALKRFKRSCAKSGVLAEVRRREHYESPSVKRRKKSEAARKNRLAAGRDAGRIGCPCPAIEKGDIFLSFLLTVSTVSDIFIL